MHKRRLLYAFLCVVYWYGEVCELWAQQFNLVANVIHCCSFLIVSPSSVSMTRMVGGGGVVVESANKR